MAGYPNSYNSGMASYGGGGSSGFAGPMSGSGPGAIGGSVGDGGVPSSHVTAQQIKNFVAGLKDSMKLKEVFERIMSDPRTQASMLRATMIQIILLVSVVALDFVIAPSLAKKGLDHSSAARYWQLLWLYPLLGLSFFCAGIAHSDLASAGSPANSSSSSSASKPANKVLDNISRALVIVQCFVIGFVLFRIPLVGKLVCFLFFCIVDAYYCFEYLWRAKGLDLKERAKFLEERWPYFAGFGVPSTVISFFHPSPLVNLALFSLAFPLNLLLAQHAKPPNSDMGILGSAGEQTQTKPAAHRVPRLPVLWIAVRVHDALHSPSMARMLNISGSGGSAKKSATMPSGYMNPSAASAGIGGFGYQSQAHGGSGGSGTTGPIWPRPMQGGIHNAPAMRTAQRDTGGAGQAHSVARGSSPWLVANAGGGPQQRQPRAAAKMD